MDYIKTCIGITPTYNSSLKEIGSLRKIANRAVSPMEPACIIFTLENGSNGLLKLLRILTTVAKIRFLGISFARKRHFTTKIYGIYPIIEQPVVIFEMQSYAEVYVMANILPGVPSGLNGYLRLAIARLTKINPLLGGVAFVIRENS
jgi:hypothetical protein